MSRSPRRTQPFLRLGAILAIFAGLLLSACGEDSNAAEDAPPGTEVGGDESAEESEADDEDEPADAGEPTTVDIAHAQGTTTVPVNPETVVVFDLGVLVTLDELGIEVDGVPEGINLPEDLQEYTTDAYTKVGSIFEPDYEQVNAMEPDLIIVASRSSTVYPELSEIAPTVDLTVDNADFVASFRERTEALGMIFEAEDEVAAQLDEIDAAIARTEALAADAGTGLIVLTSGGEVTAYGPGSRFGLIHDHLGVTPAVEDIEAATHGDAVSFEFILDANPDILFVVDRDSATGEEGQTAEQVLDNELVAQTTAWQNGDVVYLDPFDWYIAPGGLRSVASMVATIEASLE